MTHDGGFRLYKKLRRVARSLSKCSSHFRKLYISKITQFFIKMTTAILIAKREYETFAS